MDFQKSESRTYGLNTIYQSTDVAESLDERKTSPTNAPVLPFCLPPPRAAAPLRCRRLLYVRRTDHFVILTARGFSAIIRLLGTLPPYPFPRSRDHPRL